MATAPARHFAPFHKWDRNFFLILLLAIWIAILGGFGLDMARRAMAGRLSFPWIVHVHALAFTGWLLLFAAQVLLVRTRNVALHRKLGLAALLLLPMMLLLGPATVIVLNTADQAAPPEQLSFMSTQLTNVLGSAALLAAGLLSRRDPTAHKRLMLAVGGHDLVTRGRVHPAWTAAFLWVVCNEITATWLFYRPFWLRAMQALTGH
ncbi:MAG: hypothetical protein ABW023_01660 [Sphingomonas sp.]